MILEHLKTAGVQQTHKEDKITFTALTPWPGDLVCAEGRYTEGDAETGSEKRAAIFIGPEFGTLVRACRRRGAIELRRAGRACAKMRQEAVMYALMSSPLPEVLDAL
jgi:hypothetical protein